MLEKRAVSQDPIMLGESIRSLTLQELKDIVAIPEHGMKLPTARKLWENGVVVAEKHLGKEVHMVAFQNGYAMYSAFGHSTVFPIHGCRDYLYASGGAESCLPEQFFEKEPWYIRLILEGEDRLNHNREVKELDKTVSYSAVSEEWQIMEDERQTPLENMMYQESMEEMLHCLTGRQRTVVILCFFQQKTQKEAAKELGISCPAVSTILSQAIRRIRKRYLADEYQEAERA